jgi:hypothetical protein
MKKVRSPLAQMAAVRGRRPAAPRARKAVGKAKVVLSNVAQMGGGRLRRPAALKARKAALICGWMHVREEDAVRLRRLAAQGMRPRQVLLLGIEVVEHICDAVDRSPTLKGITRSIKKRR